MKQFKLKSRCQKCGAIKGRFWYADAAYLIKEENGKECELIKRLCPVCGFQWDETPLLGTQSEKLAMQWVKKLMTWLLRLFAGTKE